jgi:hypothetical protein
MNEQNIINVPLAQLPVMLDLEFGVQEDSDKGNPIMVTGPVGVGKSSIQEQFAIANDYECIIVNLVDYLPSEVSGWVTEKDGEVVKLLPDWGKRLFDHLSNDRKVVVILEEFAQADEDVQRNTSQIIHDQRLAGRSFSGGNVLIIANGNRREDKAAVNRIPEHIVSRFSHYNVDVDLETTIDYAVANDWRPEVMAFLRWHPEALHDHKDRDGTQFPTPRAWEKVSKFIEVALKVGIEPALERAGIAGRIGAGWATQFSGFLKIFRNLPVNPAEVFANPEGVDVPDPATKADVLWALLGSLAHQVDKKTCAAFVTYLLRCPPEFAVCAFKQAHKRDGELKKTEAFTKFYVANEDVYHDD